jgi:hypothetical protein
VASKVILLHKLEIIENSLNPDTSLLFVVKIEWLIQVVL